jgi:hypothetical protein
MKPPSCLVSLRLASWRLVLEKSGKLGTCCEIVATRDKKKEGEDMDIDDIRGGGTISCARLNLRSKGATALYKADCDPPQIHVITIVCFMLWFVYCYAIADLLYSTLILCLAVGTSTHPRSPWVFWFRTMQIPPAKPGLASPTSGK